MSNEMSEVKKMALGDVMLIMRANGEEMSVARNERGALLLKAKDVFRMVGLRNVREAYKLCSCGVKLTVRKNTVPYKAMFIPLEDVLRVMASVDGSHLQDLIDVMDEVELCEAVATQVECDGSATPTDGEHAEADGERTPADGERAEADGECAEADGERAEADDVE